MIRQCLTALVALLASVTTLAAATPPKSPATGPAPAPAVALPADHSAQSTAPGAPEGQHALTAQDVAAFLDGLVPYAMERGGIAGSVIVVVKDGQTLFAKGYGYADVAAHKPVVADQTLFRPGSVSKLFTWTSVMQLVGAGKLDLDRDVNDYLDFKIPPKFDKPITLRNLLTHTPGFEDGISEAFVKTTEQLMPLGDYLKKHIPARIYPPGKIVAYSNYGASLAGYIVQRTSGEQFADYVAKHIFKPLAMEHSTFVQPLPARYQANMSNGYIQATDEKPTPFELIETAPAGALSATGTDMAHFMIAHLQNGQYADQRILPEETAQLMHSPQSRMAPGMNGFALGFYMENRNGQRIIGHAGDTEPFHSDLHLLLDQNVGIFMSFNSLGKEGEAGKVREQLFRNFLDRYYPYSAPEEKTVADPKPDAARVAGWYIGSRRIESALRLLFALSQTSVKAHADGTITVDMLKDLSGTPKHWREIGPLTYREVNGQTHLKFVTDADGRIAYWISDDFLPVEVGLRVHGLGKLGELRVMLIAFVAILVLTLAIWLGGWITRRHFHATLALTPQQRRRRLASRIGIIVVLVMGCGWLGLIAALTAGSAGINGLLIALYLLGVLAILGCLAVMFEGAQRVLNGPGGWLVRCSELLLGLAGLYGLWVIVAYGLANFSLTY
ncbi:MAG TPA: serine hydrolase domain-containing protein [Steroidobacteraceae bacterium]|nr:serine hydrolase domain-containing protein [Steroidobacteraceae bacterium]